MVLDSAPERSPAGGVEQATYELCLGLVRAGHDLVLVAPGMESDESWAGVPTERVAQSGRRMLLSGARQWSRMVVGKLEELKPDVAHGQGLGFAGGAVVKWHGGARVVSAHGNIVEDLRYAYSRLGWALRAPLVRATASAALREADAVVNVTDDWKVNCPVAPGNAIHIPNPVDAAFFAVRGAPETGAVLCLAGPRRIKGLDILLVAWPHVLREMPSARLDVYGVEDRDGIACPPNCSIRSALQGSRTIAEVMERASVVVIPSRFEVSPLVAAEAMAVGVPLVATDVGGVRAMTEGVAGLCRVDPVHIAANIVSALRGSRAWEERIREGRKRSAAFRVDEVVDSHVLLYESLVRGHEPTGHPASQSGRDAGCLPPPCRPIVSRSRWADSWPRRVD